MSVTGVVIKNADGLLVIEVDDSNSQYPMVGSQVTLQLDIDGIRVCDWMEARRLASFENSLRFIVPRARALMAKDWDIILHQTEHDYEKVQTSRSRYERMKAFVERTEAGP